MTLVSSALVPIQASAVRAVSRLLAHLVGLGLLAALVAAIVALLYRWYVRERVPRGLAVLAGVGAVAIYLNTTPVLGQVIGGSDAVLEIEQALYNITAFVAAGAGAVLGTRVGDRLGTDLSSTTGTGGVEGDVSTIVQSVGRVTAVELPDEIDDIVGYDPVPESTREKLAGRTFLFPRRLTVAELRDRLVSRLKTDYGVGHVDVEITDDGTVAYLALGSRAAGIGPTLPPATSAVAIRADPAQAASAGDLVQVWETDPMRRVLTGELRGVAGDVVTIAIDAADTPKIDPTQRYRLVTLPVQDRPEREFASLLRAADETIATITVEAGSTLAGAPVGALDLAVVAVTHEDDQPEPLPARDRRLRAGDVIYAIAAPDALRKAESAATAPKGVEPPSERRPDDVREGRPDRSGDASSGTDSGATERAGEPPDQERAEDADTASADGSAFPDEEDLPGIDPDDAPSLGVEDEGTGGESDGTDGSADDTGDGADDGGDAADAGEVTDESDVPDGAAFPDEEDLPGIDPDVASSDDETGADGDSDAAIPDSDAFPDEEDLPGIDSERGASSPEETESGDDPATDAGSDEGASPADDIADAFDAAEDDLTTDEDETEGDEASDAFESLAEEVDASDDSGDGVDGEPNGSESGDSDDEPDGQSGKDGA